MNRFRFFFVLLPAILLLCCFDKNTMAKNNNKENDTPMQESNFSSALSTALNNACLPENICSRIQKDIADSPAFSVQLFNILQLDSYLFFLVDKEHPLAKDYEPEDLVELTNSSYRANREGLFLRSAASVSLEEMAAAAKNKGITLTASSAYRSYSYQAQVYERNVTQMGKEAADRESARAGHSQHQLGLVVDFGSITDAFAKTAEGRWLADNASQFGWSLSYPDGFEDITGYRWESWHYRYVGKELAQFIDTYFDGIQQYALRFIREWMLIL